MPIPRPHSAAAALGLGLVLAAAGASTAADRPLQVTVSIPPLAWFVEQVEPYPQAIIQVQGFADSTGTESLNQQLSAERAESVARYLSSEGIDPARIRTEGFASEFAARPNVTGEGRQRNRRVEVTVR